MSAMLFQVARSFVQDRPPQALPLLPGGSPNGLLHSLLNRDGRSYPTGYPTVATFPIVDIGRECATSRRIRF